MESCSSSNQQHSEAETDEIEGDDEDDEPVLAEKMDVSHAADASDVKPPKMKRVIYLFIYTLFVFLFCILNKLLGYL